jgi:hypothetical protein
MVELESSNYATRILSLSFFRVDSELQVRLSICLIETPT